MRVTFLQLRLQTKGTRTVDALSLTQVDKVKNHRQGWGVHLCHYENSKKGGGVKSRGRGKDFFFERRGYTLVHM